MVVVMSAMAPLYAGYVWRAALEVVYDDPAAPPPFPAGVALTAHVRRRVDDATPLATLTSANGGLVRTSETSVDVVIAGDVSASWTPGDVLLDIVRTDLTPPEHLNIRMIVSVAMPITRLT